MGFISKDGKARMELVLDPKTFKERVRTNISKEAVLVTDSHTGYKRLNAEFAGHEKVNHGTGEFARDNWTTNAIEFFYT